MKTAFRTLGFFFFASFVLTMLFFLVMPVQAQEQSFDRVGFVGAGYYEGSQAKGLTGFIKRFAPDSKIYNITAVRIGTVPKGSGNISIAGEKDLQADFSTGLLYNAYEFKGVHIFGIGDIGLQQTGENPSAMFGAGGGLYKTLYKTVGLAVFGTWKYAENPVSNKYQWKVNPAIALTFGF